MRAKPYVIFLILSVIAWVGCKKETSMEKATEQARISLTELRQLVDDQNYAKLGFHSPDEPERMQLGTPMQVYFVGLDRVRQFQSGQAPDDLLTDVSEMVYPVQVDDEVRCSLVVKKNSGDWQVQRYGQPRLSRMLTQMRDQLANDSGRPKEDYFEVEIPAMYLVFVGHHDNNELKLTPVHDQPDFGFEAGKPESGSEVFTKLSDAAQDFKGALSSTQ